MDDEYCLAHLVPVNETALLAFKAAVSDALNNDDKAHLRFYVSTNGVRSIPLHSIEPWSQYATLSLLDTKLPQFPRLGWRVGERHRNVDIAIASSSFEEDVRFRLFVHSRSGILMLQTTESAASSLEYANTAQEYIMLAPGQALPLLYPSTRITIGGCELDIRYTITKAKQIEYFSRLGDFLSDHHGTFIHPKGGNFPSNGQLIFLRQYALTAKVGKGTFGDVSYAIDVRTGDPVAVKDVRLINSASRQELFEEIIILERLKGDQRFLQLIDCWCEDHERHPAECPGKNQEHYYMVTNIAICSFRDPDFLARFDFKGALEMFRQILDAIQTLHSHGIMHRDLTRANMYVLSSEPPRAILGDFGKACRSLEHTNTAIGPVVCCAPEVWSGKYDNTVDLWFWAYAVLEYLGYRPPAVTDHSRGGRITTSRLQYMRGFLRTTAESSEEPQMSGLCNLLRTILVWDVKSRVGVEEALAHSVWQEGGVQGENSVEEPDRPHKRRDRRSSVEGSGELESTEPFSEEP